MVVKMSEEGSYLYLKRQSEGILMSAKCWFSGKRVNLYEGGAPPRVLDKDQSHGLMKWRVWAMREVR
jgi:hypothetical protein